MLGEAIIEVISIYTNNKDVERKLRGEGYSNLVFHYDMVSESKEKNKINISSMDMKRILPYDNEQNVGGKHYKEELAIMNLGYRKKVLDCYNNLSVLVNVIDMSKGDYTVKDIINNEGNINIITGCELTKAQLSKIEKNGKLIVNIPSIEDCIKCVKYIYIVLNSIHYFPESYLQLFSNVHGMVVKDIIMSQNAEEVVKYFNFKYDDNMDGVFISMYKGSSLKTFGDYIDKLGMELHIGECKVYCNEYYNCESKEEYYLGIVI